METIALNCACDIVLLGTTIQHRSRKSDAQRTKIYLNTGSGLGEITLDVLGFVDDLNVLGEDKESAI
ncbi:Hypothetical protein CINCED_3A014509 [Cinara cedri]|uniref:Uncharacterized protein n=1 Tax=Cinara cedri TaxID=506608 RepID=A0A5E4MBS7_9HEMI|nr:Hypothetical protein CINCED_3A014509 [Cinara cedri]